MYRTRRVKAYEGKQKNRRYILHLLCLLQAVHPFLATGLAKSKFGIDESQLDDVLDIIADESQLLKLVGLHCHLGSTIDNVFVFRSVIYAYSQGFHCGSALV